MSRYKFKHKKTYADYEQDLQEFLRFIKDALEPKNRRGDMKTPKQEKNVPEANVDNV